MEMDKLLEWFVYYKIKYKHRFSPILLARWPKPAIYLNFLSRLANKVVYTGKWYPFLL